MIAELDEELARRPMKNVTAQAEMASLRITEAAPGRIAFSIEAPDTVANYHGSVHGGFLATLLEVAAGRRGGNARHEKREAPAAARRGGLRFAGRRGLGYLQTL